MELVGIKPSGSRPNRLPARNPPALVIRNDRAKRELGFRPRPTETTIIETAHGLRHLGLLHASG